MKFYKTICHFFKKNKRQLLHFLIIYLCVLSVSIFLHTNAHPIGTDTQTYFNISTLFKEVGILKFDAVDSTFRGYFFSWVLALLNFGYIGNLETTVFLLPVFISAILSYFLPRVFEMALSWKISLFQKLVVTALFLYLAYGLIIYYLTDFYAFGFVIIAIYFAYKLRICVEPSKKQYIYWFLMGASCYVAYNVRTIYLFFFIAFSLVLLIEGISKKKKTFFFGFLWFICGATLFAIPQIYINMNMLNQFSPLVITDTGGGVSLYLLQLKLGLIINKYETYIGSAPEDVKGLCFYDKHPFTSIDIQSMGEYLQTVFTNFFSYLRLLVVHLFNMVDVRYPEVYIQSFRDTTFTQAVNYTAIGLSLSSVALKIKDKVHSFGKSIFQMRYILALLLSCLCIIPGQVETRFGIPVLIILWCFGIYGFPKIDRKHRTKKVLFILIFVAIVLCLFFLEGSKTIYNF